MAAIADQTTSERSSGRATAFSVPPMRRSEEIAKITKKIHNEGTKQTKTNEEDNSFSANKESFFFVHLRLLRFFV